MTGWGEVLAAQSAYLAEVERRLADDSWEEPPTAPPLPFDHPGAPGLGDLGTPDPDQLEALRHLARRRDELLRGLVEARAATGHELRDLSARRSAGRSYAAH